jgi:hypothetical protein
MKTINHVFVKPGTTDEHYIVVMALEDGGQIICAKDDFEEPPSFDKKEEAEKFAGVIAERCGVTVK